MPKHVDYYVSLNSPWAYLGSKRFEVMAKKHDADVTIWPVDFGSVFAVSGGLPLPKRAPQRQAYRMMELKRWRDHLGVKITLEPKFFPANEVPAARCVIALREQGRMADAIRLAHAVRQRRVRRAVFPDRRRAFMGAGPAGLRGPQAGRLIRSRKKHPARRRCC